MSNETSEMGKVKKSLVVLLVLAVLGLIFQGIRFITKD